MDGRTMDTIYRDRADAGKRLAEQLREYANRDDVIVLGLPRGGVPVAFEVARSLGVPLDIMLVRKLGVPGHEELAMGAIASGGVRVLNEDVVYEIGIGDELIERVTTREQAELERRERAYRNNRPEPDLRGKTVILVDDGLATGATIRAAAQAARQHDARKVIIAAPVGAHETCERLRDVADDVVCAATPAFFIAIGSWYEDFSQTTDAEVTEILTRAAERR